jgi:hypothetical protein
MFNFECKLKLSISIKTDFLKLVILLCNDLYVIRQMKSRKNKNKFEK